LTIVKVYMIFFTKKEKWNLIV